MAIPRRALIIIGVVVVLAVVGVIVGVVVTKDSSNSASTSTSDGTSGSTSASSGSTTTRSGGTTKSSSSTKKTTTSSGSTSITSDPTSVTYSLSAFAIGDWGTTVTQDSCCQSSGYTDYDVNAEDMVANVMDQQAGDADVAPKVVIGHGDNFYWSGINSEDGRDSRFPTTFEDKFDIFSFFRFPVPQRHHSPPAPVDASSVLRSSRPLGVDTAPERTLGVSPPTKGPEDKFDGDNIKTIPWVNVLGNHDYGGADYICSSGDNTAKCSDSDALVAALKNKFSWQSGYTSPNDDWWILEDHFYVYTIEDADSGVSIDIFNIDSNDADSHGAQETCCQCYGYAGDDDDTCDNISRGDDACAGGDTDMYDASVDLLTSWADDSRTQLAANIANSTATWKVVNSHYNPYAHYAESGMAKWFDIINGTGVHLWLNGHTHGENHDYSSSLGVHFVDNGAGGGIIKQSASDIPTYAEDYVENLWVYDGTEYGFFSLTASEDWLKLQYHTADDKWTYAESFNSTSVGGVATKHCWYIPNDGAEGQECTSSSSSS
ncbi:hypothetical protein PF005_g18855 [Phytophthora fragariae]|uniref:Calcineurin-like phosphoesterase domain-containing protein n=1 Tax=Phytophthora fragariae TaxID=53985 RepID=A0A6A3WYA6_9STRA|nr:hypothetical protein PF005_g18855 [Phytophthora fragariae]